MQRRRCFKMTGGNEEEISKIATWSKCIGRVLFYPDGLEKDPC